ncbi:MAG: monovalent cation/H(+) antiporter subunit G [Candidatus Methanomethylicaceae archaeon]|jgi:multisubunit Na+/H+ antiporter MnhG subunit
MYEEIFTLIYAAIVMAFVAWTIRKGSFIVDPSRLAIYAAFIFAALLAILILLGVDIGIAASALMKLGAAGILFAGTIPIIAATVGFFRFGEEYGPNIFYARNHIAGVIDTDCSLVMIFVGILIFRFDLVAVGFFFFLLLPFSGNALANAYYYSYQRRLNK